MEFKNKHYISKGVDSEVSPLLQLFMWQCIYEMPPPKDYLQVFECSIFDGKQKIKHIQEEPEYEMDSRIVIKATELAMKTACQEKMKYLANAVEYSEKNCL